MTIVIPLHCWSCEIGIDIQVSNSTESERAITQTFRCPACRAEQRTDVPGQITFVAKRIEFKTSAANRSTQECPECKVVGSHLMSHSARARHNYFHCATCRYSWNAPKDSDIKPAIQINAR